MYCYCPNNINKKIDLLKEYKTIAGFEIVAGAKSARPWYRKLIFYSTKQLFYKIMVGPTIIRDQFLSILSHTILPYTSRLLNKFLQRYADCYNKIYLEFYKFLKRVKNNNEQLRNTDLDPPPPNHNTRKCLT